MSVIKEDYSLIRYLYPTLTAVLNAINELDQEIKQVTGVKARVFVHAGNFIN
jgi:hypothetical protein